MSLPPPPADDRERAWIVEGLRQALASATPEELRRLYFVLRAESRGGASVASCLMMLIADEVGRQYLALEDLDPGSGN
ncbi:MAG: hypothetical protein ACRDRJ_08375 [Streptosporangiaceae bacterium]